MKEERMERMERTNTEQSATERAVSTLCWTEGLDEMEGYKVEVQVERTDADEVAFLTAIDGRGSEVSFYWSTRQAVELARRFLNAAAQDWRP